MGQLYLLSVYLLTLTSINYTELTFTTGLHFKKMSPDLCGPSRLNAGWSTRTRLTCAAECQKKFKQSCSGFLYNEEKKWCIPASGLSPTSAPPTVAEGSFYFTDSCDAYPDFSNYSFGYNYLWVALFTTKLNYSSAARTCQCLNARLFVAYETNRLGVFHSVAGLTPAWIGLDDIQTEDTFLWADGQTLSSLMKKEIFFNGYDTGGSSENCVGRTSLSNFFKEMDCSTNMAYVCEKPMCETIV